MLGELSAEELDERGSVGGAGGAKEKRHGCVQLLLIGTCSQPLSGSDRLSNQHQYDHRICRVMLGSEIMASSARRKALLRITERVRSPSKGRNTFSAPAAAW